ncbi:MAG TPA: N-acetyltransferase [Clostridia bacterium]|nr:N-acetyltransferase [Clostridia bacterium]
MFRLRPYQKGDFEQLFKLDQQCFPPTIAYSRAELSSYIERKAAFTIVAETEDRRVAGFVTAEMHPKGYGHIITIDTRPEYRRQKLGSLLIDAAERKVRDLDGFMVVLEVAVDNKGAISFYKRHGYTLLKTLPRYYNGQVDGLFLTKRL